VFFKKRPEGGQGALDPAIWVDKILPNDPVSENVLQYISYFTGHVTHAATPLIPTVSIVKFRQGAGLGSTHTLLQLSKTEIKLNIPAVILFCRVLKETNLKITNHTWLGPPPRKNRERY
jgi:hypothetical protein